MAELLLDFITTLDGYGAAEGWPGWWGLQGPEYLAWLDEQPERNYTILMGANTYRLMAGFAGGSPPDPDAAEETASLDELTRSQKLVFSATLQNPLAWENCSLVRESASKAVAGLKRTGTDMRTIGSLALGRSLMEAGLVDRLRLVVFPVITGATGRDRIFDAYPDVALELVAARTFDGRLQLLEYAPTVLEGPPG